MKSDKYLEFIHFIYRVFGKSDGLSSVGILEDRFLPTKRECLLYLCLFSDVAYVNPEMFR